MRGVPADTTFSTEAAQPDATSSRDEQDERLARRFRYVAIGMAIAAATIGAAVLFGWLTDSAPLKSLSPRWVPMKANTALCLLVAGLALMVTTSGRRSTLRSSIARVCALVVFAVGAATFGEYVFGWHLGIDQLLFQEAPGAIGTSAPGRMAFSSTLCFIMLGVSLLLRDFTIRWAQSLGLAVALMGTLSLLGYVYSVPAFQGVIHYAPMAVHTAAAFVLLGIGILLSTPREGITSVISSPASGGRLARRMLPVVICLPPALGILRILGANAGWYPDAFGISLKDGLVVVLLATVVWFGARATNRLYDAQQSLMAVRSRALAELQETHNALERTNRELTEARAAAERANGAKSDFLSRMSHELRTPLNAILGFAQLLELGNLDGEQRESVDEVARGGRHLLALTNEILDIARIESGRLSLSLESVLLEDVLEESVSLIKPLADAAGISIEARCDSTWEEFVLADQQRLRQIVLNLLSNAVKYNRPHGSVTVCCKKTPEDRIHILVTDTGPGIDTGRIEQLFEPFERLGAEQTEVEGTGLGLALSKHLAEAMGGSISVESEAGVGTTFAVQLQAADSPFEQSIAELNEHHASGPFGSGCVLYIEDNRPNIRLVEMALSHRPQIELVTATMGEPGVELAKARHPSVALVDLNLPDIDGMEVLTRLRDDPATSTIPVIILSADATPRRVKELLAAGAYAYMTKPFDLKELLDAIDRALSLEGVG